MLIMHAHSAPYRGLVTSTFQKIRTIALVKLIRMEQRVLLQHPNYLYLRISHFGCSCLIALMMLLTPYFSV